MGCVPISIFRNCSGPNKLTKEKKMAAPAPAPCPREKEVKIAIDANGNIQVAPSTFHVGKSANEEVVWTCNVPFEVDFVESPFNDTQFTDQLRFSGLVRRSVLPSKTKRYKYTVTIAGYPPLDPDGQVDL
jgi:hypothetical protein